VTLKGLPMTYNRDLQEDKPVLFEAAAELGASLEMARVVAGSASLAPEVAREACEGSWVVATDIAESLARGGMPFHQAHQTVGQMVLEGLKSGKKPAEWSLLDGIKTREIPGGTGPRTVAKALRDASKRLARMRT
jgi:argininosuccinate lyase